MKSRAEGKLQPWKFAAVCFGLVTLAIIAYWPVHDNEFVNYDDNVYITENPHVLHGFNWADIKWAFTTGHTGYSHPVTWLSHQLDYSIYGAWAGGHHVSSVVIHALNSVLLFLFAWRMSRKFVASAIVAGIWVVHPLHVESVAWVAERKDVLSGLFFLLTLHAYLFYASKPRLPSYLLVFGLFVLGILSKPMLVTLPCVLLLLDYWPLQRLNSAKRGTRSVVLEKVPFFVLAAAWSIVTFTLQKNGGSVVEITHLDAATRLGNAFISYAFYLWKTVWPIGLAVFYPYPDTLSWKAFIGSFAVELAISVACFAKRKRWPFLWVGWLWFLGMLMPAIGLIQVGNQARADRYTYLPQIGLCLAGVWFLADVSLHWRYRQRLLGVAAMLALLFFSFRTWMQCQVWQNSESLWRHALVVTPGDDTAYNNLGAALAQQGKASEALACFDKVGISYPNRPKLHYNIARVLIDKGEWDEAIIHLEKELEIRPDFVEAHDNLGIALAKKGRTEEALLHFQKAIDSNPNVSKVNYNLAGLLLQKGDVDGAIAHLKRELEIDPNQPNVLSDLGIALSQKGLVAEAIGQWQKAIAIQPDNLNAQCNLAWIFATCPDPSIRDGPSALKLAMRANQLSGGENPKILSLLAAAYAENGQFDNAIQVAQKAVRLARDTGNESIANSLMGDIASYQRHSPLRDSSQSR